MLLNLAANAVKFTDEGEVTIAAVCQARRDLLATVEWSVTDSGIGIAPEKLGQLFSDFAQADASISRRFGGTGLGLAISRRIIEQMGGTIGVTSTPGEGSTFRFTLVLPWSQVQTSDQDAGREEADDLRARIAGLDRPLKVLVAEDDAVNRMVVSKMLGAFDVELRVVTDGVEAVAAVSEGDYDIVLMDVRMPEMDGLAATRAIRAEGGRFAALPIIALTANAFPEDVKICREAGMSDFLAKPLRKPALVAALLRALDGLRRQRMTHRSSRSLRRSRRTGRTRPAGVMRKGRSPARSALQFPRLRAATTFRRSTEPDSGCGLTGANRMEACLPFFQTKMLTALPLPLVQECSPNASLPSSGIATCLHGPVRFIMLMTVSREIAITATVMVLASRSNIMQLPPPVRWTVSVFLSRKPSASAASEPFASAEPLAGLADIADGDARGLDDRSEQRVVGTPADRIDADLQNVIAGQGHDRGLLSLRAGCARSALAFVADPRDCVKRHAFAKRLDEGRV